MGKIEIAKKVVGLVVSVGVGAIINNAVKCTTPGPLGIVMKIFIGVGSFVVAGMVSDKAVSYTDERIDDGIVEIKKIIKSEGI